MTLIIKFLFFIVFTTLSLYATKVEYKEESLYSMTSNMHLINDIAYKKESSYQVLVEIPAGTLQKWEVEHKSGQLQWEFKDGKPREVNFLAYPGNYGFIPQTRSGDGDPLDIIVLSESAARGEVVLVHVIGMLKFEDSAEEDTKILAISKDGPFQDIKDLKEMLITYPHATSIIKSWFEAYKGHGYIVFEGYGDREMALEHIEKAHIRWSRKKF